MMPAPVNVGEHLVLESLVPPLWAAVAVLALAAVVVAVAILRPAAVARGRRVTLLALRLAVVGAAGLLLLGPVIKWQGEERTADEAALLVDASKSMAIRDAAPSMSRTEAVREAFTRDKKPYADLAAKCSIKPYAFGTYTRATDDLSPKPADPRTDIGEALGFMVEHPGRLAAVVLISDGRANRASTSPEAAARQLAMRGIKVHAVVVGSDQPTDRVRDVAVRDLRAPARVLVGNRAEIRAVVATLGMVGKAFEAVLTIDGKEAERRRFAPGTNQTVEEIAFTPQAERPGLVRVALAVEPMPDELITTNNRAESSMRVDEGDVRVLYLDGRIHPEGKFLARAIGEARGIDLDRRILLGGEALKVVPSPEEVDKFNVIMIGDLPASAVPAASIGRIAERVREGRLSVLTLGGLSAYGAGGWATTPLAEILPFAIRDGDGQTPGPIRFRPAAQTSEHFIFSGDTPASPLVFDSLPPLAGASAVGAIQPTARLLAASPEGLPLLAVREFDRGRVAALTVDTTWQWALAPSETRGAEVHRRFWRQLVLWLAGRDSRPQADLWVMTDRPRYMLSDPDRPPLAEVTVHARGSTSAPAVEVKGADGATRKLQLSPDGGDWRAIVPLTAPGTYMLTASAGAGSAETKFVVEEQDFETANILADAEGLGRIASAGGGTIRRIDRLGDLLTELAKGLAPQAVPVERRLPLGSGRVFLAMVLALLSAEWVLRRRWGLV